VRSIQASWSNVVLVSSAGEQLVNLSRPPADKLPRLGASANWKRALDAGRPALSGVFKATADSRYTTSIAVPVVRSGKVRYVLVVTVDQQTWLAFLSRFPIAADATITLVDREGTIIARTLNNERWVGQKASPGLLENVVATEAGTWFNIGLEGQRFYSAHSRSPTSGWAVATGVPVASVEAALRTSTYAMTLGALLAALLATALALVFGRRIARAFSALAIYARELPRAPLALVPAQTRISEADALGLAFQQSATLLHEREQAINEALKASEASNRAKDEFLAMLGHELRNPIGALRNATEVLKRVPGDSEQAQMARGVLERQVGHMTDMVDDLLDVARATRGRITLTRRPLDLAQCVSHCVDTFAGRHPGRRIEIEARSAWVDADETRVEQILVNLLSNAVKYTPHDKRISVLVEPRGGDAVMQVTDEGAGIAHDLLPRVFDLFTQEPRAADRAHGGLGLGLTLVRRLAELHGGSAEGESGGPGHGARFTVRLPRIEQPPKGAQAPAQSGPAVRARRVLVIEDHADNREMLASLLRMQGHTVAEAADGPAGVERAQSFAPEIAFVDIGLPGFDGYEVARRIRAGSNASGVHLIALTGYGQEEDRQKARDAGFDAHLVKPVESGALEQALARA
jgi:signal transduction histidine kinase